jgi:hypothetical protein
VSVRMSLIAIRCITDKRKWLGAEEQSNAIIVVRAI